MEILYKYAEDKNGNIIHINNAQSEGKYICPECKDTFIFKNGKIRQKHFSHNHSSANCNSESYLHKTFKLLLLQKINNHIKENTPIEIFWVCNICKNTHNDNLIMGIKNVKEEYTLDNCRPDIVLFNENGQIPIIIEIVVKHEPEMNVIEYCKNHNIVLIRIKLETIDDITDLDNKIKYPSNVVFFNNMKCINYQYHIMQTQARMNTQIMVPKYRTRQRGPNIEQIEAAQAKGHGKYYVKKNNYRNKSKRK